MGEARADRLKFGMKDETHRWMAGRRCTDTDRGSAGGDVREGAAARHSHHILSDVPYVIVAAGRVRFERD